MNENYIVKGSVRTLEQRSTWMHGSGLDHLPNHENFDVEFTPTRQVQLETIYTNATYYRRSRRHAYDGAGKLIRTVETDRMGMQVAVSDYEYSEGRSVCTNRDGTGIVTRRDVEEYAGTLQTFAGSYDGAGQPMLMESFEYTDGKLLKTLSKHFGRDGELYETWICHYDSIGRIVETFGLTAEGRPLGDGRYKLEYDDEGRKLRILSYNDWDNTNVPNHINNFVYKCDEHGNWIERNDYFRSKGDPDWTKHKTTRRLTYYGQEGR